MKKYNFAAGPSPLFEEVEKELAEAILHGYHGLGIEGITHRSVLFGEIVAETKNLLRELLEIPPYYRILFMHGGASLQYICIALNFGNVYDKLFFAETGNWGRKAFKVISPSLPSEILKLDHYRLREEDIPKEGRVALYYVSNETAEGIRYPIPPVERDVPLLCDMSSDILSRPVRFENHDLIFFGNQKNVGIAGLGIVLIHEKLLSFPSSAPDILNYAVQVKEDSIVNTPPTLAIYSSLLTLRHLKKSFGSVENLEKRARERSSHLYAVIDEDNFYQNLIPPSHRSDMNVVFDLPSEELTQKFAKEAEDEGFYQLKGHKSRGGIRVSLYNHMPLEGARLIAEFMRNFRDKNKN